MAMVRKKARVASASYLEQAGLRYLERYAASSERVRKILMRKVKLSAKDNGTDEREGAEIVERLIAKFVQLGMIRDRDLAVARAERLHERGASRRMIQVKLGAMGLQEGDIREALREVDETTEGDSELEAAWSFARRKKLGPYRGEGDDRKELRQRDLGAMARGGFSYGVAHRVIDASEPRAR